VLGYCVRVHSNDVPTKYFVLVYICRLILILGIDININ
jgi:hypothetical protein